MKNGVECYKDFFPYFKALKTNCGRTIMQATVIQVKISQDFVAFSEYMNFKGCETESTVDVSKY